MAGFGSPPKQFPAMKAPVRETVEAGVEYISVGALTHSARAVDFSLEIIE